MAVTQDVVVGALVVAAIAVQLVAAVGVAIKLDVYDRLHYLAAATTFGPFLLAAAVLVQRGVGADGLKATLVAVLLVSGSPLVAHALGRAARIREVGALAPRHDEDVPPSRPLRGRR